MRWVLLLLIGASWACSGEDPGGDLGPSDVGPSDAGTIDLGTHDAAQPDAGPTDTGPVDMGEPPLPPVVVDTSSSTPPARLSDYHLFRFRDGHIEYNDGVVPYELNTALFSDYALKSRAIWLPAGQKIQFQPSAAFDFPVGSAIIKSFLFAPDLRRPDEGVRMIETRLLVRYADGWHTLPYLWRADQSDADYFVRGQVLPTNFIDPDGRPRTAQYLVPQRNQCLTCHELYQAGERVVTPIGPKARHLNRDHDYGNGPVNQLQHLADLGYLQGLPALSNVERAYDFRNLSESSSASLDFVTLEKVARDYLDVNCAHCHNPLGVSGMTSQLFLNYDNTASFNLGVCKEPGSAGSTGGRRYDIVPGDPDASILNFRIESETLGVMMPQISRSLRDSLGTLMVRAWIGRMPPRTCP